MVCITKKCDELKLLFKISYEDYIQIRSMENELLWAKLQRPQWTYLTIYSLNLEDVKLHFRLENHDQVHTYAMGFNSLSIWNPNVDTYNDSKKCCCYS